ncbi:hypothetical protein B0A66_06725 [Flavobacterium hercynium]|uniref:Uncharacterized protein n=1 Tax=Flavobacterium hercynium TaxID=387094 RepID=A0A226HHM7_9FLAO|nr:hypothetical protein B0A66_06725 [Flavobacterium hercynium]
MRYNLSLFKEKSERISTSIGAMGAVEPRTTTQKRKNLSTLAHLRERKKQIIRNKTCEVHKTASFKPPKIAKTEMTPSKILQLLK